MPDQTATVVEIPPRVNLAHFLRFLPFLRESGYVDIHPMDDFKRYACILRLIFTHAIITGTVGDRASVDDRWCYHSYDEAQRALSEWVGRGYEGEPTGWHRHPASGRRREDGDPAREEVRA